MAKRRGKSRRRNGMTIPLAPVLGLVAGLAAPSQFVGESPISAAMAGNLDGALKAAVQNFTGVDPYGHFDLMQAKALPPLIIGVLIHKFVGGSPLNVNATLGQAKVPYIRI